MSGTDNIAKEFSLAHLVTPTTKSSSELEEELIKVKQTMAVSEVNATLFEWILKDNPNRPPETSDLQEQMDYVDQELGTCEIMEECARSRLSENLGGYPQDIPTELVSAVIEASKESLAKTFAKGYEHQHLDV